MDILRPIKNDEDLDNAKSQFGSIAQIEKTKQFYYHGLPERSFQQGKVRFKSFRIVIYQDNSVVLQAAIESTDNTGEKGPKNILKILDNVGIEIFNEGFGEFQFTRNDKVTQYPKAGNPRKIDGVYDKVIEHPTWTISW